ncbi:MAG: Sec-independent protein translocase protein TatB [Pseudomonadota bacterium]
MNLMPGVGFFELVVIAVVALVVVGPKDLPRLMRAAGKIVAQARRMAGEFSAAFNQMARESEMEDMRREIDALKRTNVFAETKQTIDDAMRPVAAAVREEAAEIETAATKPLPERAE